MRVLITGGSDGIGKATAKKLQDNGHEAIVFDKQQPNYKVDFYHGDVRDEERVKEVIEKTDFEVLVNCAGFYELGSVEDMALDTAEKIFDTNVHGYLNFIRHSMPMLREKNGRIVNITSVAGRISMPFFGVYCGSKHAMESISDSLRIEEDNVDVGIVEPGVIETGFNERARNALKKYVPGSFYSEKYEEMLDDDVLEGVDAEKAAETVLKAVTDDRVKRRYQVPFRAKAIVLMSLLPNILKDRIVERAMK